MTRSILVNGWDLPVRLSDFELTEAARNGEVGQGGIDIDSENAGVDVNGHWSLSVQDTEPADTQVFMGYVGDKEIARGPFAIDKDRQFDINTVDLNTILGDDIITGGSGNRPAETDIARVTWLVGTSFLNGMGATIGASGATNLEASDYREQTPLSLLTQAAETGGKLFFVYWDFATSAPKLFYDLATASNFITSSKISTYLPDGSNSTTHHPHKESLVRNLDYGRIYSEVLFKYDGGSVTVTNTATASNYRARKTVVYDNSVKTSGMATTKANQYLATANSPEDVITLDVDLTAAQINEFRAGQLMQIKAPHLGLPSFVDRRIVRKVSKPRGSGDHTDAYDYRVTLELSPPKTNQWGNRGVPTNLLPDSATGGGATSPATLDYGSALGKVYWDVHRQNDGTGGADADGASSGGGVILKAGSWVYNNVPYTDGDFPCPIGGGSWIGWHDRTSWVQFTAPADADYLGLIATIDATALVDSGFQGGYELALYPGTPSAGMLWQGTPIGSAPAGGTVEVYIPRSLITWGASNALGIRPKWRCLRPVQFCNSVSYYGNPEDDGRASSGSRRNWEVDVKTVFFASGTTGMATDVAALGAVDGSNTVFELIAWDGTGSPSWSINGLDQSTADVIFDTGAKTATLATPPPPYAVVLWDYPVAA